MQSPVAPQYYSQPHVLNASAGQYYPSVSNGGGSSAAAFKGQFFPGVTNGNGISGYGPSVTNSGGGASGSNNVNLGISLTNFSKEQSILQTAIIPVVTYDGFILKANVLFDTGADKSYVTSNFSKKIKAKTIGSEFLSVTSFGGGKSTKKLTKIVSLNLVGLNQVKHGMQAFVTPSICKDIVRPVVPVSVLNDFSHLQLAESYDSNCFDVDILIGIDHYWNLMLPQTYRVDRLIAQNSCFGYILCGTLSSLDGRNFSSTQLLCVNHITDDHIKEFWSLESQGISGDEVKRVDDKVWRNFSENVAYTEEKRYEVSLPWKNYVCKGDLVNNVNLATKRLMTMHRKFANDPDFLTKYYDIFCKYELEDQIEQVPNHELDTDRPIYYMPHRPVVKESSSSTRIRPVFDASAPSYNNVSLNDLLDTGPPLNPDIVEILIRFRRWPIAMTSDITKAFLQISVNKSDRDVHRFLLLAMIDGKPVVRHMRFTQLPFGNTASPFLLNATIRHHLSLYPESPIIKELVDNMFVDNWLSGGDTLEEAFTNHKVALEIFGHANMPLTQWHSNSKDLSSNFDELAKLDESRSMVVSVLGMSWLPSSDCFSFESFIYNNVEIVATKRALLSVIAKLFDPLGFLSPFVMHAKILFQDCWRLGIDWNDPLPQHLKTRFIEWISDCKYLRDYHFNRCYFPDLKWTTLEQVELHAFGDASEKGFGCTIYMKIWDPHSGIFRTSFVAAKSRVAPIKKVTLPRLELLAALLTARFIKFVIKALRLNSNTTYYCWSDSKVTLSWIKGNPYDWKMFVANRVTEIQNLTSPSNWFYCPGSENPADLITRGLLVHKLLTNPLWLRGPPWLSRRLSYDIQNFSVKCPDEKEEQSTVFLSVNYNNIDLDVWSSFTRAQRTFAWILRFIFNCRNIAKLKGPISQEELTLAKDKLFICAQINSFPREIEALRCHKLIHRGSPLARLNPILDKNNILRARGRLENANVSYETRCPIIIPRGHLAKLIVSFQHLTMKHAGVCSIVTSLRINFFIIGVRKIAKNVCRECVSCKRFDSRPCNQPVAPLPSFRVTAAPPFSIVGLDYAGPLYCSDFPSSKFYLLLFTCSVIRAVHLEITNSLALNDCVLAVRRFVARRGLPSTIYSDNAKTFKAFSKQLGGIFGHLAPSWKFIAPLAPWWGGWWERLIKSVKGSLKKSVGTKCLTRCELETVIHEVEACLNSRPLTFASGEIEHENPLTPAHFLIGRPPLVQIPTEETNVAITGQDLREREIIRRTVLDLFWKKMDK